MRSWVWSKREKDTGVELRSYGSTCQLACKGCGAQEYADIARDKFQVFVFLYTIISDNVGKLRRPGTKESTMLN